MSHAVVVRLNNDQKPVTPQGEFADACALGARLKAARKKMRLNQTEFGLLGGVSINTQRGYEDGTLPPIDYLLRIGEAGVDWYWVVTGNRIAGDSLSDDVLGLVSAFRTMPPALQLLLLRHAQDLSRCWAAAPSDAG